MTEFIDDMAARAWADVVVCRSGALTVSEKSPRQDYRRCLCRFNIKTVSNTWNALPLEKAGAAKIIEQSQLSVDAVANTLAGVVARNSINHGRTRPRCIYSGCHRASGNEVSRAARA
ncbi:glycosyltransferase [Klebsiella pneumoniae]|uniref:glycosyltransferase n=1 Tax=Klebsiella pneumoniae TaxID=573 RepID=UPI003D9778F5